MPLNYTQRNISAGSQSPAVPLITNNPAFSVRIVPLDGRMEQRPNQTNDGGSPQKIRIGDTVRGEIASKTKKRGASVIGRVLQVELERNQIVAVKVMTQRGTEVFLDPTTTEKMDLNREGPAVTIDNNRSMESLQPVLLYDQWKLSENQTS